jgi:hypothetical protein
VTLLQQPRCWLLWVCHPARPKRPIAVSLGWLQAVPPVIMRPIGATRTGAGPTAAGIKTGSDLIAIIPGS